MRDRTAWAVLAIALLVGFTFAYLLLVLGLLIWPYAVR